MEGGKKDGKGGVAGKGRRGEKRHGEGRKCIDSGRCTRETVCLIECKYVQVRRSGELYMPGRGIGVGASFTEQPAFTITSHTRPFTIVSSPPLTFPFSTAEPHGPRLLFISNSDASFASLFLSLSLSLSLSLFLFLASFLCHCTFLCRQSVTRIPLVPPFSPRRNKRPVETFDTCQRSSVYTYIYMYILFKRKYEGFFSRSKRSRGAAVKKGTTRSGLTWLLKRYLVPSNGTGSRSSYTYFVRYSSARNGPWRCETTSEAEKTRKTRWRSARISLERLAFNHRVVRLARISK